MLSKDSDVFGFSCPIGTVSGLLSGSIVVICFCFDGDFVNLPSGPRGLLPLLLCSWLKSAYRFTYAFSVQYYPIGSGDRKISAQYCFLRFIGICLFKICSLGFFSIILKAYLLTPFALFYGFVGSWSDTPPASLNECTNKVSNLAELESSHSFSDVSSFNNLLVSVFGFLQY